MTTHRATNWLLAGAIVALYLVGWHLDGASDIDATRASTLSMQDAIAQQRLDLRFARAAAEICGPGQPWRLTDDGSLACLPQPRRAGT
jgi:hypothetical protein